MVNFNKYTYNGWGLSISSMKDIYDIIVKHNIKSVVEFGSGQSTNLLVDLGVSFVSFDHDEMYAFKHNNVFIKKIKQFPDVLFKNIISNRISIYDVKDFKIVKGDNTRQKNCFYDIKENELPENIDMVIIDGPHGNGRSLSFNSIFGKTKNKFYILLDDYHHYPFESDMSKIYKNYKLIKHKHNEYKMFEVTL